MTAIFTPEVVQVAGALIVGAVLIQVALTLVSSFRRITHESDQRRVSLEGLRHRAAVWRAESEVEQERAERSWSGYRKFRIHRKVREIEAVHSFYLTPHDGKPLPPYEPGQYLTFQLRIPDRPKPVIRCYSLSDSPGPPDRYRVTIKKVPPPPDKPDGKPGLSSTFFNDHLQEGDILDVKAPGGSFVLSAKKNTPVVLIGGGIGITPVLSMLNAICDSVLKRETWFFLGVRNRAEHLMKEHLENLERENEHLRVCVCYSEPGPDDEPGRDYHHKGYAGVELELLSKVVYGLIMRRRDPGVLHLRI